MDSQKLKYYLTSAKSGHGVNHAFMSITEQLIKKMPKIEDQHKANLTLRETHFKGEES